MKCREQHEAQSRRLRGAVHFRDIVGSCRVGEIVRIPTCPSCFSSGVLRLSTYCSDSLRATYLHHEGHRCVTTVISFGLETLWYIAVAL